MTNEITLRDRFAIAALPALISRHRADVAWSQIAPTAYQLADALIVHRETAAEAREAELRETPKKVGWWVSAALDDPNVCAEMKADIAAWFAHPQHRSQDR
jgi:hypothetical protein